MERKPVWVMPPVRETWVTKMLGLFKHDYPCQIHFVEPGEIITRPEGTDD
jgi:hypothetical protein